MIRALVLLVLLSGCSMFETKEVPRLATGRITSDFGSYDLRRVGLLPMATEGEESEGDDALEEAFHAELVAATGLEVVRLTADDLLEVKGLEPFRRGSYPAQTLLELRRRFLLDALAVGAVSTRRVVPPQRLGVQLDLVSCETGATIWSANILLDAGDRRTRDALESWSEAYTELDGGVDLVMLSPRRFARFAAWQVMQLL